MPEEMKYEVENREIQKHLREMGRTIKDSMPAGWGFTLLMFDYNKTPGDNGSMFYLSSAERDDMLKAMVEFVERFGNK
jgi:hypothetical protein